MNKNILFGFFIILLILFSGISFADLDEYTAPLDSKIDLTKYFNAYYTVLLENSEVQYFGMLKNAKDLTTKTAVNPNNFDITLKQKIQDYKNALSITNVIVDSTKPDLASLEISRIHQTALVDQADIREQLEELYDYVEDINEDCIKDGSFDTDNKKCVLADDDYDDEDFALDGEPTSGYAYSLWGIGIIIVLLLIFKSVHLTFRKITDRDLFGAGQRLEKALDKVKGNAKNKYEELLNKISVPYYDDSNDDTSDSEADPVIISKDEIIDADVVDAEVDDSEADSGDSSDSNTGGDSE